VDPVTAPGTSTPGTEQTCPHEHGGALGQELRALALVALDRLDPLLARLRDAVADAPEQGADARVCVVCTTLAAVRAERPELAGRLAAHAAELAAALREALGDRGAAGVPPEAQTSSEARKPPARTVQRIPVVRVAAVRAPVVSVPAERGRGAFRRPSC
jgi:acyl transferase domain-containing protein